jgi:AraC family transcriptional activator of pobA
MANPREDMDIDRLAAPLAVVVLRDAAFGSAVDRGVRAPHRHDYHELLWTRSGSGSHLIDGERSAVRPLTVTVIGRGQVHVFEAARGLSGAVVRFGGELLFEASPAWLVGGRGALTVDVPVGEADAFEGTISTLAAELARPQDGCSVDLQRHLLSALLLWVERWHDDATHERPDEGEALYRRFVAVLERDFARFHDAAHYADALAVPAAALSRALATVTGRTTKQLVTDRALLEAARLLRFTDLTVGEIAFRAGYEDQLYFSRAFKRRYGMAPSAYRDDSTVGRKGVRKLPPKG